MGGDPVNRIDPSGLVELDNDGAHAVLDTFYTMPNLPDNLPEACITLCGDLLDEAAKRSEIVSDILDVYKDIHTGGASKVIREAEDIFSDLPDELNPAANKVFLNHKYPIYEACYGI